ncbi:DUF6941 family protein [Achromobacter kerstersii]
MVKCLFGVICTNAITDSSTNNVSLIDVLESIDVGSLPMFIPNLAGVFSLEKDDGEADDLNLELGIDVNGVVRYHTPVAVTFAGRPRTRLVARFGGYPVMEAGRFAVVLSYGDQELCRYPVDVRVIADADAAPTISLQTEP